MNSLLLGEKGGFRFQGMTIGWRLGVGDMRNDLLFIGPNDMSEFSSRQEGGALVCAWRGNKKCGNEFTVRTTWRKTENRLTGTIEYAAYSGKLRVEEVHFPSVTLPLTEKSRVLTPSNQGDLHSGLCQRPAGLFDRGPFKSFQYTAVLEDGHGYYFDHRDPAWNNKEFLYEVAGHPKELTYHGVHPVPLDEANRRQYRVPYENSVARFEGGWYESARIYRNWALEQSWFRNRRIGNPMRDIALWVWNRGAIDHVIPPVEQLRQDIGAPVALDWYWWHHNPYDTDYPEFWPPREGVEKFKAALRRLSEAGIFTQVYTNGMAWDLDGVSWTEGGDESVVVKRDGQPCAVAFNRFNHHRLGFICGEGEKFQRKIRALAKTLHESGLPGVYLDMIGCASYYNCYSAHHTHAPGGGDYHVRGYRKLIEDIRR